MGKVNFEEEEKEQNQSFRTLSLANTMSGIRTEKNKKFNPININNFYQGVSNKSNKTSVIRHVGLQPLGKVGISRRLPAQSMQQQNDPSSSVTSDLSQPQEQQQLDENQISEQKVVLNHQVTIQDEHLNRELLNDEKVIKLQAVNSRTESEGKVILRDNFVEESRKKEEQVLDRIGAHVGRQTSFRAQQLRQQAALNQVDLSALENSQTNPQRYQQQHQNHQDPGHRPKGFDLKVQQPARSEDLHSNSRLNEQSKPSTNTRLNEQFKTSTNTRSNEQSKTSLSSPNSIQNSSNNSNTNTHSNSNLQQQHQSNCRNHYEDLRATNSTTNNNSSQSSNYNSKPSMVSQKSHKQLPPRLAATQVPILTNKELENLDTITRQTKWASGRITIDYDAKLNFSDDEDEQQPTANGMTKQEDNVSASQAKVLPEPVTHSNRDQGPARNQTNNNIHQHDHNNQQPQQSLDQSKPLNASQLHQQQQKHPKPQQQTAPVTASMNQPKHHQRMHGPPIPPNSTKNSHLRPRHSNHNTNNNSSSSTKNNHNTQSNLSTNNNNNNNNHEPPPPRHNNEVRYNHQEMRNNHHEPPRHSNHHMGHNSANHNNHRAPPAPRFMRDNHHRNDSPPISMSNHQRQQQRQQEEQSNNKYRPVISRVFYRSDIKRISGGKQGDFFSSKS